MLIMRAMELKIVLFLTLTYVLLANGRTINDGTNFSPVDSYKVREINPNTEKFATGTSEQYSVNPVPKSVASGSEGQEKELQLKPLKPNHVLLKELFKTARNLQNDKIGQKESIVQGDSNILLLDLHVKQNPDFLLDINPGLIKDRLKDFPPEKGASVVPILSDLLCQACREKGDLECIKRHCLTETAQKLPEKGSSVVPILSDLLCQACREKGDLECIKRHCLTETAPKNPDSKKPIVPVLSDLLCQACKEKGDLECIKIHCLTAENTATNNYQRFVLPKPALV